MNLVKLRFYMIGTLAVIIGISTLAFTVILSTVGAFSLWSVIFMVAGFNIFQWLIGPYIVDLMYGVKRADRGEFSNLYTMVDGLAARTGISAPALMVSELPIPNAFAYGSPLTGSRVAVTRGLLRQLEPEEIEAVIGHEFGHLRHRDVQVMLFVSLLPSLFYILARYTLYSSYYSGGGRDAERRGGGLMLISTLSMLVYFVLLLFTLGLSRLREYYADQHSVTVVQEGDRKLSEALAKISIGTWRTMNRRGGTAFSGFKTLFISDPDRAGNDAASVSSYLRSDQELVREISSRRITSFEQMAEIFSTHPNIVKRIKALTGQA